MSIAIRLKHSAVNGKAPQPADLSDGELALNINDADPAIYLKDSAGAVRRMDAGAVPPADWTRAGTVLSPTVAGDDVTTTGDVNAANVVATGDVQTTSLNGGQLAGMRNILINGNLTINQRGVDVATAATGSYGQDRWKKTAGGMTQIVEEGNFEPGATYTLSGTGITTQQLTAPASGNWTIPDVPVTARKIQLEPGPVATPFEHRPIGLELQLCQRYFYVYSSVGISDPPTAKSPYSNGYASAPNTSLDVHLAHPVRMRVSPTAVDLQGVPSAPGRVTSNGIAWAAHWASNPAAVTGTVYPKFARFNAEL